MHPLSRLLPLLLSCTLLTCTTPEAPEVTEAKVLTAKDKASPKYSLGQWSFNREHFAGEMTTFDFVEAASELGFDGVDYVSQFFKEEVSNTAFLDSLKAASEAAGIENVMILVDGAGNLGASDRTERDASVKEHMKWVKAAKHIGCPTIRVNAHGDGTPEEIKAACMEGIGELIWHAQQLGIGIVIENHGGISNNGAWLADLVGSLQKFYEPIGALADFDNWCVTRENGQIWGAPCTERYDRYQGFLELMPHAHGVSAKAFNFDDEGNEPDLDFGVFFDILHATDYDGWLGIEYEGDDLPSKEGIQKTLALAKKNWARQPIIDAAAKARLDSTLAAFAAPGGVAGISALVYEKGEEVYFNAAGFADVEGEVPMDRNTIVQIYSMTKPLTATALMQLHEIGRFTLDDPVANYIPELKDVQVFAGLDASGKVKTEAPKRPMTIRDLTRHTAGFYNGGDTPALKPLHEAAGVRAVDHTLTELAEKLASVPLLFHPGEQWEYGPSVDLQALLVERISGQPFDEYLREHVLDPLGMTETRYFIPETDRHRLSSVYSRADDGTLTQMANEEAHAFNINEQILTPGGWGLTSTLDDYMTFARMLVNDGTHEGKVILSPKTIHLMATNHLADSVTERLWLPGKGQVGFGIDFAVRMRPPASPEENNGRVGEFFWDGAASTLFWVDPANELTAVLFVQLFPYDQIGLHREFREAVYGPWRH